MITTLLLISLFIIRASIIWGVFEVSRVVWRSKLHSGIIYSYLISMIVYSFYTVVNIAGTVEPPTVERLIPSMPIAIILVIAGIVTRKRMKI